MEKPLLDLNVSRINPQLSELYRVAALPGGEAVIAVNVKGAIKAIKVNSQGRVTQDIYSCTRCSRFKGLLVLGEHVYLIHGNGTVFETRVSDRRLLSTSTIPDVSRVMHYGSLSSKPDQISDKQTLLLADEVKHEVFTFKPSTGEKQVRITRYGSPASVSYFFFNDTEYYIVTEAFNDRINIYNNTWDLLRTIGTMGSDDQKLDYPLAAVVSEEETIIVSDFTEHRVSEFSLNGTFLHHLLVESDGIDWPRSMSYYYPHLWLTHGRLMDKLYRYQLYG